jgi:hypothetical protein
VQAVLGHDSPDSLAARLVHDTVLGDRDERLKLWNDPNALKSSTDPMIALARKIEPEATALEARWENEVVSVQRRASEAIARARFARDGTTAYPDATFTQRLSFGIVKGWSEQTRQIPAFTDFAGLYRRATGADPFKLSQAWLDAKGRLNLSTPFDFATTNDIIGGNSGSPVIDKNAHAVGLIFDGNIHSLGGDFLYDGKTNRAVAVDTAALLEALRVVYKNTTLPDELVHGHL